MQLTPRLERALWSIAEIRHDLGKMWLKKEKQEKVHETMNTPVLIGGWIGGGVLVQASSLPRSAGFVRHTMTAVAGVYFWFV